MEVVEPIWPDFDEGRRFAQLRAALDQFTSNGLISISEEPYQKSKTTFLARVDPIADEVWDIRVQDPKPGIRCLGCFSAMDEFVALTWNFRENLDGPRGPKWAAEINRCKASWRSLFPSYAPHNGSNLNAYVSDKFYAV
ncbi:MAG: hypothetical protein K1X51_15700 [Rhodospirillaceae bacterium]|nr:hypothetical protein [Rhodospirillaceae bacterium]